MKKPDGRTIARIVLSLATIVSLIVSIQISNVEFSGAVAAFFITGLLLLATTIAFSSNHGKSENSDSSNPELTENTDSPNPVPIYNSGEKKKKRGTPVLVVGSFFGSLALYLILDLFSGKYGGSGGMGGLVILVVLSVVGPIAAIFLIVGLAMRFSDTDSQ